MKKTAIIYSFNTKKTAKIAEMIRDTFNDKSVEMVNAEDLTEENFMAYEQCILGVPTWFDGELPNYWDEFIPALEDLDLKGKKYAVFGLGNQKDYPQNYQDGLGIMARLLEELGGKVVGHTSAKDYSFESSGALVNDNTFYGLAIDFETQGSKNKKRVQQWVETLKKSFE